MNLPLIFRIRIFRPGSAKLTVTENGNTSAYIREIKPNQIGRLLEKGGVNSQVVARDVESHFKRYQTTYEISGSLKRTPQGSVVRFEVPSHFHRTKER